MTPDPNLYANGKWYFVNGADVSYIALNDDQIAEFNIATAHGNGATGMKNWFLLENVKTGATTMAIFADGRGSRSGGVEVSARALNNLGISFNRDGANGRINVYNLGRMKTGFPVDITQAKNNGF